MSDLQLQASADHRTAERGFVAGLKGAGRAVVVSAIVVASLLTFPSVIPWMIAVWLGWQTWLAVRGRPGWLPLGGCALILLVKRIAWPPGMIAMLVVMLAACVLRVLSTRRTIEARSKRFTWAALFLLWLTWGVMTVDWHAAAHCGRRIALQPTRPVVCLGDSLTAGLSPHGSYTENLAELIAVPVVNLGQAGVTAAEALEKLPALVEANPQVVIVELGGHDFLKGYSRAATKTHLERIVEACRTIGAEVILMEIPRGFITDPYAGLERELARRHDLELVSDTAIRKLVLWSPFAPPGRWLGPRSHLSDDGLHPNARGNRVLAGEVAGALARLFGPAIRGDYRDLKNRTPGFAGSRRILLL